MRIKRPLVWAIAIFVFLAAVMAVTGRSLVNSEAPFGIVSFQLAFTESQARTILESWTPAIRRDALLNLLIDFPFMIVYGWLLSLLCQRAARVAPKMARFGTTLARLCWVAVLFDGIENFALLHELHSPVSNAIALLAGACATLKFAIIACVLVYLILAESQRIRPV